MKVHQEKYIQSVLRKNGLEDCNPATSILPDEFHEDEDEKKPTKETIRLAQKAAGELQWLSTETRPGVTYSVQLVSVSMQKQPMIAVKRAKRIMRYLAGTEEVGLRYKREKFEDKPTNLLEGYSDSSFAPRGGCSHGAIVVMVAGMVVLWKTKKQPFVTLSAAESELLVATQVLTAARSVEVLLKEIIKVEVKIKIKVDNAAALSVANPVSTFHWRTRHLKVRAAAMIEALKNKEIEIQRSPGRFQLADIGT